MTVGVSMMSFLGTIVGLLSIRVGGGAGTLRLVKTLPTQAGY